MASFDLLRAGLLFLLAIGVGCPCARAAAPAAPSNCTAVTYSPTASAASIYISWNDNSTNETYWKIQYSVNNGAYQDYPSLITSNSTATTGATGIQLSGSLSMVYRFKILAFNGTEYSLASNIATVGTYDLNSPINLGVTALDPFNVAMNWEEGSTSETGFAIEMKTGAAGAWQYLGYLGANSLALDPSNLIYPAETFSFRIRAFKGSPPTTPDSPSGANVSAYSNVVSVTAGAYTATATAVSGKPVVNLSWPDILNESGYQILCKAAAETSYTIFGEVAANVTTYQVLAPLIEPSTAYTFVVRPFAGDSSSGIMGQSGLANVTVDAYPLTATAVPGQTAVNLSWTDLSNETGYQILFKEAAGYSYNILAEVAANVTTYQVTAPSLEGGKSYSFVVRPLLGTDILCMTSIQTVTVDGITSKTGTSGSPGELLAHTFTHVSSSTVSSRTLTGTPSTLTFNSATGELTGPLPAVGIYTLNYTVNFTNGSHLSQVFYIRVRPPAGPPLVGTVLPAWSSPSGASRDTPLAGAFTDPEAESAVRVHTSLGDMDFILFDTATPATVTNFMSYVNAAKYTDVAFHRSIAGFVIQGGGFKGAGSGSAFTGVVTNPPVTNEPGIANVRGTISMAKSAGNPNSATSQFFVSLGDNRANLDYQNGGFTVFGRVAGNGMAVADLISALPTATYDLFVDGSPTATPFADFPMNAASAPDPMDQTKLVKINSVFSIPVLSYSITGNTHPAVATASIVDGKLHLAGLSGGQTTITVTATDLDNLTTSQDVLVNISDYSTWTAGFTNPVLAATAATADPDNDGFENVLEYVLGTDPRYANQGGPTSSIEGNNLKFTFKRKITSKSADVALAVEVSTDLIHWSPDYHIGADTAGSSPGVIVTDNGAGYDVVTVTIPNGSVPLKFARLKATLLTASAGGTDTYSTWAARTTFPGGQNAAWQDPDGDNLTNLQEYAFLGDPAVPSQAPQPVPGTTGVAPAPQYLTLRFPLRKSTTGLTYQVEANNQLTGTWTRVWSSADGLGSPQVVASVDQADRTVVTIRDIVALGSQSRRFMRVRVTQE